MKYIKPYTKWSRSVTKAIDDLIANKKYSFYDLTEEQKLGTAAVFMLDEQVSNTSYLKTIDGIALHSYSRNDIKQLVINFYEDPIDDLLWFRQPAANGGKL